jgi:hypothetical protein
MLNGVASARVIGLFPLAWTVASLAFRMQTIQIFQQLLLGRAKYLMDQASVDHPSEVDQLASQM